MFLVALWCHIGMQKPNSLYIKTLKIKYPAHIQKLCMRVNYDQWRSYYFKQSKLRAENFMSLLLSLLFGNLMLPVFNTCHLKTAVWWLENEHRTGYTSQAMLKLKKSRPRAEQQKAQLAKWCDSQGVTTTSTDPSANSRSPEEDQVSAGYSWNEVEQTNVSQTVAYKFPAAFETSFGSDHVKKELSIWWMEQQAHCKKPHFPHRFRSKWEQKTGLLLNCNFDCVL